MATYKDMTLTEVTRAALRFFWNITRNYNADVEDDDFFSFITGVCTRAEVLDAYYRRIFPNEMADVKPHGRLTLEQGELTDGMKKVWNHKPLRRASRNALRSLCELAESRLEKDTAEDRAFRTRFADLCAFLSLSELEADILMFAYVMRRSDFCDLPVYGFAQRKKMSMFYAMAVDAPYREVCAALSKSGRLARYNCLEANFEFNMDELDGYFDGIDPVPLDRRYYRPCAGEVLPWEFFGRLAEEEGALLQEMLLSRARGGRLNVLLYGEPGTGKTSFARALGESVGMNCYELLQGGFEDRSVSASSRMAGLQIFNSRLADGGNLLIVDEADELLRTTGCAPGRGGSEKGVINTLLDGMETPVVWISNAPAHEMDESVRRRFDFSVHFKPLTALQRMRIWNNNLRKMGMEGRLTDKEVKAFAVRYGTSAGGITMVLDNVRHLDAAAGGTAELVERIMRPHCELMALEVRTPEEEAAEKTCGEGKGYSLEGLNIKGQIDLSRILAAARTFRDETRSGRTGGEDRPRFNLLLWGPPGTGKTAYVQHLGRELGLKVITKMGSDLLDMYVGGTEARIRDAFAEAEREKAILFFDEIDGMLQNRSHAVRSWEVTQVNELLHRMENFNGIFVGATNFRANLDPAVLRRFTFKVEFDYLTDAGKRHFFQLMFRTELTRAQRARLNHIGRLAPGDFRTVRQALYYLGETVDNDVRLSELEKEAAAKDPDVTDLPHIGF